MKKVLIIFFMALVVILTIGGSVYALEGPVTNSEVGIIVTPGWNAGAMGQYGGSNETFSNFDASKFLEVYFTMDEIIASVDGDFTDTLSFSAIVGNQAVWTGQSNFTYYDYYGEHNITVDTRFTLTSDMIVKLLDPTDPLIQLSPDSSTTANFLFEGYFPDEWSYPGPTKTMSAGWYPIGYGFNQYNTSGGGLQIISFEDQYYYEPIEPCEGNFDRDGDVDGSDLAVFAADFGRTDCRSGPPCEGDFDQDGDVDGSDLATFAADFGRTDCP